MAFILLIAKNLHRRNICSRAEILSEHLFTFKWSVKKNTHLIYNVLKATIFFGNNHFLSFFYLHLLSSRQIYRHFRNHLKLLISCSNSAWNQPVYTTFLPQMALASNGLYLLQMASDDLTWLKLLQMTQNDWTDLKRP